MKLYATFNTGDLADSAVRELKSAGIEVLSRRSTPLERMAAPRSRINELMYMPPSGSMGLGFMGVGMGMYPYDLPPMSPPVNLWGDMPINPDKGGQTRLELELDESSVNQARGILVSNNGTDIRIQ